MTRSAGIVLGVLVLLLAAAIAIVWNPTRWETLQSAAPSSVPMNDVITRGEYLARAGDCVACHTVPGQPEFSGGRPMPTPFGNLYVPNITPEDETGIGRWTADDFYKMMHTGRSRDDTLLYPAMPFANYTKVTRADSDAIYAYLMSVPPVKRPNRPHELRFPFNQRELLLGWRALYFKQGEYVPDPKQYK
jgi:mono/diheme cytochrome c family protein